MALGLIAIGGFTLLAIFIWNMIEKNKRPKGYPPGPLSWPIVGNLLQIGLEPYKSFIQMGKKYGGIFSVDYGSYRSIVVNDVHLMKKCLNDPAFAGRPKFRMFLDRTEVGASYARGIAMSELETWSEQRRFVVKHLKDFGFGKSSMEVIIQEEIQEFMKILRKKISQPVKTRGLFNAAILNSIWRICTGARIPQEDLKLQKILASVVDAASAFSLIGIFFPIVTKLFPKLSGYEAYLTGNQAICKFVTEAYNEHKPTLTPGRPRDLMDLLIEEVNATTDQTSSFYQNEGVTNIIKTVEDLFGGGSETTSSSLTWFLLCMALYPEVQEKMYDEIYQIVGETTEIKLEDRARMPYANCVIMELLRFTSIFPLSIMRNTVTDVTIDEYFIPKGTVLTPNLYAIHHSEEIWGDPETFRPERFLLPDGTVDRGHEALLPFSFGKRVCIGEKLARAQLFLFSTSLIQNFRFTTNPAGPKPSLKPKPTIVLSPIPHELIIHERF